MKSWRTHSHYHTIILLVLVPMSCSKSLLPFKPDAMMLHHWKTVCPDGKKGEVAGYNSAKVINFPEDEDEYSKDSEETNDELKLR